MGLRRPQNSTGVVALQKLPPAAPQTLKAAAEAIHVDYLLEVGLRMLRAGELQTSQRGVGENRAHPLWEGCDRHLHSAAVVPVQLRKHCPPVPQTWKMGAIQDHRLLNVGPRSHSGRTALTRPPGGTHAPRK